MTKTASSAVRSKCVDLDLSGRQLDASDEKGYARGMTDRPDASDPPDSPDSIERRSFERIDVTWSVDCETDDTFLYAAIANISEMGIFVRTTEPLMVGTLLTLRFVPPRSEDSFVLQGRVQWVNAVRPLHENLNPGMGVLFTELTPEDRERIVETIRTIAYLREDPTPAN